MSLTVKIVFSGIVALVQAKDGSVDVLLPAHTPAVQAAMHHVSPHRAFLLVDADDLSKSCPAGAASSAGCPRSQFSIAAPSCSPVLPADAGLTQTGFGIDGYQVIVPDGGIPAKLTSLECVEKLDLTKDPKTAECPKVPGFLLANDHRWMLAPDHWGGANQYVLRDCLESNLDTDKCNLNARFHFSSGLLTTARMSAFGWDFATLGKPDAPLGKKVYFASEFAITLTYPDANGFLLARRELIDITKEEKAWLNLVPEQGAGANRYLEISVENAPFEDFVPRSCPEQGAPQQLALVHSLLYQPLIQGSGLIKDALYPTPVVSTSTGVTIRNPPACEPVRKLSSQ